MHLPGGSQRHDLNPKEEAEAASEGFSVDLGATWGSIGIMEKKMETTIMGVVWGLGFRL